jgi:hypothetical protein
MKACVLTESVTNSFIEFPFFLSIKLGAGVICEPWFTGSPEICELEKNVNHKKIPNIRCTKLLRTSLL